MQSNRLPTIDLVIAHASLRLKTQPVQLEAERDPETQVSAYFRPDLSVYKLPRVKSAQIAHSMPSSKAYEAGQAMPVVQTITPTPAAS